jgi:3-dehydroquinate synthase
MERISVISDKNSYNIYIDSSFNAFPEALEEVLNLNAKVFIITDSNVLSLYKETVKLFIDKYVCRVFSFQAGEQSKNIDTINSIYEFLIDNDCDRNSILIGLGGGVVGDLTGFAASTFMRGIKFINVPTTLTAQVDSAIGGKVGYNYKAVKNLIGFFYNPAFVFISTHFLKTLEDDLVLDGLGEIVKYALINSSEMLEYIDKNYKSILQLEEEEILCIIKRCVKIKVNIIAQDFMDLGLRNILNFGHTVGHAVEADSNYEVPHGKAVALGILAAIKLSERYLKLDAKVYENLIALFKKLGLADSYKVDNYESFLYAIKHDKKNSDAINFVLLKEIGEPKIKVKVVPEDIIWALKCSIDMEEKL